MRLAFLLYVLAGWAFSSVAFACMSPPTISIREQLLTASSIAIFQLESTEFRAVPIGDSGVMPLLIGRVRVVETLKGPPSLFKRFTLGAACNDLRLDVGDFFLLATTQRGESLTLGVADASVLVVSPNYRGNSARTSNSQDLRAVIAFLSGKPLPKDFPSEARFRTEKYHLPPPCQQCGDS